MEKEALAESANAMPMIIIALSAIITAVVGVWVEKIKVL